MKIGINGRFLLAKKTGVQRAAYTLLKTIFKVDQENQYFLFTGSSQLTNPDWQHPNVTVVPSNIKEGDNIRNHLWEQFVLPKLARRYKVDLLHSPANMAPLLYQGKSVVNIYDLCFVVNPQWYSFSFRTLYNFVIPRIARRASKVITNSNNSRNDLLQFCGVPAQKVSLNYLAVDDFFLKSDVGSAQESEIWPKNNYILYAGSLEPRKNIKSLIEAYQLMRDERPNLKTKLVLIGGESHIFSQVRISIRSYKDDVIFKGFVDDRTLQSYYRHATLVAYPSLYEGFGLPPLEAMASGTPVVTSGTSSIPEVVGRAAMMVEPTDVRGLAAAMARVIEDPKLQQTLIDLGREQVRKFNWYRVARSTLAVYHEVHNTSPGTDGSPRAYIPMSQWAKLSALESEHVKSLGWASSAR